MNCTVSLSFRRPLKQNIYGCGLFISNSEEKKLQIIIKRLNTMNLYTMIENEKIG